MRLTRLGGDCPDGRTCPTIYATDRGTIVVQGYKLAPTELAQINLPHDESAVEIPTSLLEEVLVLTAAELGEYIDARLTRSAFRLELLDHYDVEADGGDFDRYVRGEAGPSPERKQPWLDRLRRESDAGILNHRVHVLSTPLTPYLRYECEWGYAPNAQAGEDIGILDQSERPLPEGLVDHDFWLVDDRHAIRMHYDERGRFLGAEPLDQGHLPRYQHARDVAAAAAEPFRTWWARHPEEWRCNRAA